MVEHLLLCDEVGPITIVDCDSTYGPLIDWYEQECPCRVIREPNLGNRAAWQHIHERDGFYFESDADLDFTGVPYDMLIVMRDKLMSSPEHIKVGMSLRLDDLPDESPIATRAQAHEANFWKFPTVDGRWYQADIDTTAAVYRGGKGWCGYGPSLRAAPPYMARHPAWYVTPNNMSEEWRHYLQRLKPTGLTWSPILQQKLKDAQ